VRRLDPIPFVLVGLYLVLGCLFAARLPYGTPPDEAPHLAYVRYLAQEGRLPTLANADLATTYEYHQPPLYYALLRLLWSVNPRAHDLTSGPGERPPSLVVSMRLFGVVVTGIAVAVAYTGMRKVGLDRAAATSVAGLYAFVPMNVYMSAAVNNDVLASFLNVCVLCGAAIGVASGFSTRLALGLGFLVGLGVWTKTACLMLVPVVYLGIVLAASLRREASESRQRAWRSVLWFTLVLLVVASPWLVRNSLVYGDPVAGRAYHEAFSQMNVSPRAFLDAGMPLADYVRMWARYTFTSFWGLFGHTDVPMPGEIYYVLLAFCIISLGGMVLRGLAGRPPVERAHRLIGWLLAGSGIAAFAAYVRFNLDYFQAQARYLAVGIPAACFLLGMGWAGIFKGRARTRAAVALVLSLVTLDVCALYLVIIPHYGV
jgi:4-amino-4-deoxy-L-arabinose transferase-like glycosyltransferase